MIRRCHFQNVRCLRDVELTLEPLTVLVGPNASGKSTVLDALAVGFPMDVESTWQHRADLELQIDLEFDGGKSWMRRRRPGSSSYEQAGQHRPSSYYQLLRLDPRALRKDNQVQEATHLEPSGANLANVFATLSRSKQIAVAEQLAGLVPVIRDVEVRPTSPGQHRLRFQDRWEESTWYPPAQISDGTMLLLAFLVLQHQESPVEVIGIEDPERGLHPYLLQQLVELLRRLSRGELGPRAIQCILSTHSAELLDCLEPREVRFMERTEDGSVRILEPPVESPDFEKAIAEYHDSLGATWLSGGLGGVPDTGA